MPRQQFLQKRIAQRPQFQPLAARANGGQQPPGRVGKQQQHGVGRRLFQHLQQRIGGVVVHVIGSIHDGDPPAAGAAGHAEEIRQLADLVHRQHRHQLARALVDGALEDQEARMRLRRHLPRGGVVGRHGQIFRAIGGCTICQQIARDAIGQRRLAGAGCAGDQPGTGRAPRAQGACSARQRHVLSGQVEGLARVGKALHAITVIGFGCGGTLGHDAL